MAISKVYFDFLDGGGYIDVSSYIKYTDASISSSACNSNFQYAQNTAIIPLIYDSAVYPLIQTATSGINVYMLDESGLRLFTGHIALTKSQTYNGKLDTTVLSLEATDRGDYLDKAVGGTTLDDDTVVVDICYRDYTVMDSSDIPHSIVHQLAYLAGFSEDDIDPTVSIPVVLNAFSPPSSSDTYKDLLDALLFEYGYTLNFNEYDQISPIKWLYSGDVPGTILTDNDIIGEVTIVSSMDTYDGAEVVYYELAEGITTSGQSDILLYRDSQLPYDDDGTFLGYTIFAGYTYPPETNVIDETTLLPTKVYQTYEDTAISYWTNYAIKNQLDYNYTAFDSDFSSIVATSGHYLSWLGGANVALVTANFYNTQAEVVFSGTASTDNLLYYANIYGKVLYKSAERTSTIENVDNASNINQYVSTFIFEKTYADILVKALASQAGTEQLQFKFTLDNGDLLGTLVRITLGTGLDAVAYVRTMTYSEDTQQWKYEAISYSSDMSIALTSQTVSKASNNLTTPVVASDVTTLAAKVLTTSTTTMSRSRANVLTPTSITATATNATGTVYLGRFVVDISDGANWETIYTSSVDEYTATTVVPVVMPIAATYVSSVRIRLYAFGGTSTLLRESYVSVSLDSSSSAIYWGVYDTLDSWPTTGMIVGDYLLDGRAPVTSGEVEGGAIRQWDGLAWIEFTSEMTGYSDAYAKAKLDLMVWADTYGVTTIVAINAIFKSIAASTAFITELEATNLRLFGTLRTGENAEENARVGIQDATGVGAITFTGTGNNDMSVVADGTEAGDFIVKISKGLSNWAIGDTGPGGGIIYYINATTGYALEAAPADQSSGIALSSITDESSGATATAIGTGLANTNTLVAQTRYYRIGETGPAGGVIVYVYGTTYWEAWTAKESSKNTWAAAIAASYSHGGYTDWVVPSLTQSTKMYTARVYLGNPTDDIWTTEEFDDTRAYILDLQYGASSYPLKTTSQSVWVIRVGTGTVSVTAGAAKTCSDLTSGGKSDWHLPSRFELSQMQSALGSTAALRTTYGFTAAAYWSSSEVAAATAYAVDFSDGSQDSTAKSGSCRVRAVRALYLPDKFSWYKDSVLQASDIIIAAGAAYVLGSNEISIKFSASTGHILDDQWSFTQGSMYGLSIKDASGTEYVKASSGVLYALDYGRILDDGTEVPYFLGRVQAITASATIDEATDTVLITSQTTAMTLTLPAGLAIGKRVRIERPNVSTTYAVTVLRSGSETIEGATSFVTHGSRTTAAVNSSAIVLEKCTSTAWRFVEGIVSGETSAGWYERFPDRHARCGAVAASPVTTSSTGGNVFFNNDTTITFPIEFADLPQVTQAVNGGSGATWPGKVATRTTTDYLAWVFGALSTNTASIAYVAEGIV